MQTFYLVALDMCYAKAISANSIEEVKERFSTCLASSDDYTVMCEADYFAWRNSL